MALKYILLDLDGTCVNTETLKRQAHERTVGALRGRWLINDLQYLRLVGTSSEHAADFICKNCELTHMTYTGYRAEYKKIYRSLIPSAHAHPGVVDFLKEAQAQRVRVKIVTSSASDEAKEVLIVTNIFPYVEGAISGDDVKRPKPAPDPYIAALHSMRGASERSSAVVLEDTESGIQSALSAGLRVMAVRHGMNTGQDFRRAHAHGTPNEFLKPHDLLRKLHDTLY